MNPLGFVIVIVALAAAYVAATSWRVRQLALGRLYRDEDGSAAPGAGDLSASESALARWLSLAGYRQPNAPAVFVGLSLAAGLAGLVVGQVYRVILQQGMVDRVASVPGSAGELLVQILRLGPWILFVVAGLLPMMAVRSARRARVHSIERDLPLALEMFATMAEAGLGFDAALSRIVRTRGTDRPLTSEFIKFQLDMLAGVPRIQALRQLGRRADVPSLTGVTSALIQAEQVGASIAETLQHQAADLRERRREDALLQAQALPVKLVFPLVICFLPGIFVSTLAPVLYQMVEVANSVLRSGR